MRIAVFLYGLTGGGATRRILTLAKGWAQEGHEVDLVVVKAKGPLRKETFPLRVVALDFGPWRRLTRLFSRRLQIFFSRFPLAKYLRGSSPDVFLSAANHAHLAALGARRLARKDVPLILRLSNHLSGAVKGSRGTKKAWSFLRLAIIKRRYPEADFVIAVCQDVLRDFLTLIPYPKTKTTVIYNPIEVEKIRHLAQEKVSHPWFQPKKTPVILGAGRLSPQKDFFTLIRALHEIREETSAKLLILGEGKQRKSLEKLIDDLSLRGRVALPGFTPNPWAYMAKADVFALSSRWEGLPGVLIEAMACGCPVVSTDCPGGAREILLNGRLGPLVPVGDAKALGKAILSVLENPPSSEILKRRAEDFDVPKAISAYLDVFDKLSEIPKRS